MRGFYGNTMASDQASKTPPTEEEITRHLRRIKKGLKITKITCTRSVKGRNGDSFVGFSAAWQSVQDDVSGPGADVMSSETDDQVYAGQGLSLKDAKLARYMLASEADLGALESALANGSISVSYFKDAVSGVRKAYNTLVMREMGVSPDGSKST